MRFTIGIGNALDLRLDVLHRPILQVVHPVEPGT